MTIEGKSNRIRLKTISESKFDMRGRFSMVNRGEEKVRVHMNVVHMNVESAR